MTIELLNTLVSTTAMHFGIASLYKPNGCKIFIRANAFGLISNLTDKIVTESFPTTINNSLLLSNSIVPDNSGFPIFLLQLERWTRKALAGSPVCREYPMLLLQHLGSRNIPTNGNLCYEADFSLYFIEDKDCKWCQDLRGRSRGEIESDALTTIFRSTKWHCRNSRYKYYHRTAFITGLAKCYHCAATVFYLYNPN